MLTASACGNASTTSAQATEATDSVSVVYYIKDITPENLMKIYKALGREAKGNVGVKISTGESNKSNQLNPN